MAESGRQVMQRLVKNDSDIPVSLNIELYESFNS